MANSWISTSLGEILRLERRPIKLDPDREYAEIGIYSYGRGIFHKRPRTGFEVGDKDLFQIKKGDFIFQITFAWEGAVGLAAEDEDGMYGSVRFPTYRVNEDICYPPFLLNYFKTAEGRRWLIQISPGSAGRNRVLATKRLPEILVPLPSLTEQRRIVAHIEALAARVAEAQRLRGEASEEAEVLLASVRSNSFTELEKVFPNEVLGNLIQMTSGQNLTSENLDDSLPYPVYGGGGFVGKYSQYLYDEIKIAIGRVGARCGCVYVTEPKSWVTDNALVVKGFSDSLYRDYLVYALTNLDLRKKANQAAQPVVSQKNINPCAIPLPPPDEQRRLVTYLDGLQAQVSKLRVAQSETARELNALMPSVLDRAFKGEM